MPLPHILLVDPFGGGHHVEYNLTLAQGLAQRGFTLSAAGAPAWLTALQQAEIPLRGLFPLSFSAVSFSGRFLFLRHLRALAQALRPDLVHYLYLDHFILPAWLAGLAFPAMATLHWGYFLPPEKPAAPKILQHALEKNLLRRLTARGLRIATHSPALSRLLTTAARLPAPYSLPYPAPLAHFWNLPAPQPHPLRARLGITLKDRLILLFGGTRFDKGADLALRALALLPPHFHLLLAGREEHFTAAALTSLAQQLGVASRLHLDLRFFPEAETVTTFQACDIFLLPYRRMFTGQSGPLLLAAALGKPLAAPRLPILTETVEQFQLGALYPPEDLQGMAQALQEETFHPRTQALRQAHSAQAFVQANENAYQHLLAGGSYAPPG